MRQSKHQVKLSGQKSKASQHSIKLLSLSMLYLNFFGCNSSDDSIDNSGGSAMSAGEMTSGEMTSGEMTSGEMTSGEMTSGEMTSGEMTSGEMTSGEMAGMELPPLPPEYPVIRRLRAYINREDRGIGVQIEGRDEDNDVIGFTLQYYFDDGEPLFVGENGPEPIAIAFSKLSQGNGDFVGEWSIPVFTDVNVDLQRLSEVRVTVLDGHDPNHESHPERRALIDAPILPDGEQCDLNRGLSRCEEMSLCGTAAGGRTSCQPAVVECPDYYEVIDLNESGGRYEGDTTGRPTYGVGTCGGGTSTQLFSFTAMSAGNHTFVAQPTGVAPTYMGNPDTLMWIRSHCAFSDWAAEIGCNDDINRMVGDLGSRISVELSEGQTVFIFIDGFTDIQQDQQVPGWSGPFVLEVTVP